MRTNPRSCPRTDCLGQCKLTRIPGFESRKGKHSIKLHLYREDSYLQNLYHSFNILPSVGTRQTEHGYASFQWLHPETMHKHHPQLSAVNGRAIIQGSVNKSKNEARDVPVLFRPSTAYPKTPSKIPFVVSVLICWILEYTQHTSRFFVGGLQIFHRG